jgi:hypothetical protein
LGKAVTLLMTPDKELTIEARREKTKRNLMLNADIGLDSQLDTLTNFLSQKR